MPQVSEEIRSKRRDGHKQRVKNMEKHSSRSSGPDLRAAITPEVGWCSRAKRDGSNEDYVLVEEGLGFGVADGIGGAPLGDAIARYACHIAMRALKAGDTATDALDLARKRVSDFTTDVDSPRSGTSIAVVRIDSDELDIAWAGDTALYTLGVDDGQLTSSLDACGTPGTRPLGHGRRGESGSIRIPMEDVYCMAVCTDGVWRSTSVQDLATLLAEDASPRRTSARMVFGSDSRDDATALVARFTHEGAPDRRLGKED